jgi:methionyl-tRNA formyltransferase
MSFPRGEIVAVYTQPDRPAGRGQKLQASPVKELAAPEGTPVHQPTTLKTVQAADDLRTLQPDLLVVVAYGLILPKAILEIPRLGGINVHASLLPRWRGAAPIQRAIMAGDLETGITIMQMDEGLDTGPMLAQVHCAIALDDTAKSLHDRLAELGARCLTETLPALLDGHAQPRAQDEAGASYAPKIERAEARLLWTEPAAVLVRKIQAFNPKPVAFGELQGVELRLWEARAVNDASTLAPGQVSPDDKHLDVGTGAGILRILRLQLPGKRPISATDFLNAHPGFARHT